MSQTGDSDPTDATQASGSSSPRSRGVVFISHEKSDDGLAHEIRSYLQAGGFTCWLAPDDIHGPTPWPEQISNAIDACDVMLVIVSAHANRSPHVSREVDLAVEKAKPLLPVRVEDIAPTGSLDYLLRLAQWIDLFPGPIANHAASLQYMVGSMLTEHGLTPPAPEPQPAPPPRRRPQIQRRTALTAGAVAILIIAATAIALQSGEDERPAQGTQLPTTSTTAPTTASASTTPPSTEPVGTTVQFEDGFDGSLDGTWAWFLENPDNWSLTAEPGWLQLVAGDTEQNLLLRDAPNDAYEISTLLRFAPTSNFQFAGLVVGPASDATTLLQFGRAYCDPAIPSCIGDGVYFDDLLAGEQLRNATAELPPETDTLHLRVVFDGTSYLASFSTDGDVWQLVGEHVGAFGDARIGLVAHQGFQEPAAAQFDYVTVMSPPPETSLPSFEQIAAAYPDGAVCDTKVDLIGANPDGSVKIRFPPNTPLFDDRIEFPCWGMRLTALADLDILGMSVVAGSTLVAAPATNPAVLVDETGASESATVGAFVDSWYPPAGLSLVTVTP